ncbi:unnamed protein product [Bursaphelenchus okinawaensis]|uniref:G-protein coupled receptors family 1 profile domain-containing protein n=1 Tax=Bursaphelenchus okinawaensis TaxID=465554 RepID=A0A811K513_9BILA|nr:unnamed protein product [Bursaphelenchus okinawaensis]CAG9091466.1 unnamed protein product [Bursaphelenchus okinawaensis]
MSCDQDEHLFDLNDNNTLLFLSTLHDFKNYYSSIHKYVALLLCLGGLIINCIHISILTLPRMRNSSVHTTLTCIALADLGTMTSYLIYITRFEFFVSLQGYAYAWALFLQVHAVLSIALHALSIYLVTLMAFLRLMAMSAGQSMWMKPRLALTASFFVTVSVFTICIPTFLAHEVMPNEFDMYNVGFSSMFMKNGCNLLKLNLWLTGIFLKAVPCFLLMCFTMALLRRLRANDKKRQLLFHGESRRSNSDRVTYMLLLMVFVFLVTELPQGMFAILNAMFTYQFHRYVYVAVADVLDLLSLINCYVCFSIYTATSSTYRQTLLSLLPWRK